MKSIKPTDRHLAFMADVKAAMLPYTDLSSPEILALLSQLVGNAIALQDQNRYTPEMVLKLVADNIEVGNKTVVDQVRDTKGSA